MNEYDVVVFGGGPAGTIAAIQSARLGVRTALVEKNGILGGTTVVASVNFPGLFHAWGRQVIKGIGWELIERVVAEGGANLPDFSVIPDRHWKHQVLVNRFVYAMVLDEMCVEAGVDLRMHEMPGQIVDDGNGLQIVIVGKEGLARISAGKIVDATGDGNIAALMGYPLQQSDKLQPATLIYELSNYDLDDIDTDVLREMGEQAVHEGRLLRTDYRNGNPPLLSELRSGGGNVMHVTDVDGSTSPGKTEAELRARGVLARIYRFLRTVPGCENVEVSYVANECGIRDTRRIVGETQISGERYKDGYVWPDGVCYSFYPIDIHIKGAIDTRPLERGVVPIIPYRALIPRGSRHLLAAGRCISGDLEASSAYRVQASSMATGQVAGAAVALAARHQQSVQDVDLRQLRSVLEEHDAIVPPLPTNN